MLLYRAFHAQKNKLAPHLPAIGLSSGQPKILNHLLHHDACIQRDLAQNCDIEPATVSRILYNMERAGLIARSVSPQCRRETRISITDLGKTVCAQWEEICAGVEAVSLEGFTEGEKALFCGFLARMYHNLTGRSID
ncbi:MAG: MarR family transcriptional regulator [Christensenellaceae bacterium]|nr:MarR family transcriptional regulator [Christensenellaceae bacterium]